jgi:arylsulfatase A-like enzyme
MNVILIISDSLRRDHVPCYTDQVTPPKPEYGPPYKVYAPCLEEFGSNSLIFDNAYVCSFPTVPCRNDILTGRYTFLYKPWAPIGDEQYILSEVLNKAGYVTALFADTPHPFAPGFNYQRGFQAWDIIRGQEGDKWKSAPREVKLPCNPDKLRNGPGTTIQYLRNVSWRQSEEDYFPARTMRAAASWLEENRNSPFFLYIDTFDPHEPWDPPAHYLERYSQNYEGEAVIYPRYDVTGNMKDEELRHCRARYAGEVSLVDHWIGFLLDRVQDLGIADETMIIVMTDHGFYLGEHNYIGKSLIAAEYQQSLPLYTEVSRIPFMMRVPGYDSARINTYVQPVDVMPTILDFLSVDIPPTVQGRSIMPVIRGETEQLRPFCISSTTISGPQVTVPHPTNRSTITYGEWTLIFGSQAQDLPDDQYTHMVDSIRRKIRVLEKWPILPELYHLPSDPMCNNNCIDKYPDVARAIHAEYFRFLKENGMEERHLHHFAEFPSL